MIKLDGQVVSSLHRSRLKEKIREKTSTHGSSSSLGLAVVLVGEDPASQIYVRHKVKACEEVGIHSHIYQWPRDISEEECRHKILQINQDPKISGLLVQLPLPPTLREDQVLSWIDPLKDVDGLCVENVGLMWSGRPRVLPCTPHGVMKILEHYKIDVARKNAVVIGRSQIVGQPMACLLQRANATVTVCHSHTPQLMDYTRKAELLVVAAGQPSLIGAEHIQKGAVVVDVGIHRQGKTLCGDVRYEEIGEMAHAATPVPGGVGPMTVTMLLENTYRLASIFSTSST